jgi:hypothetical protein
MVAQKRKQVLERSSVEAYASMAIGITLAIFPVTWWLKLILLLALGGILCDIWLHSTWVYGLPILHRRALSAAVLVALAIVGWRPITDQYVKDAGTDRRPTQSITSPRPPSSKKDENIAAPLPPNVILNKAEDTKRIFLTMTPDELMSLYTGLTPTDGKKRTRIYLDKWITLSVPLRAVDGPNQLGVLSISFSTPRYNYIGMEFEHTWADRFAVITLGQIISVNCQIKEISEGSMYLRNCELADN